MSDERERLDLIDQTIKNEGVNSFWAVRKQGIWTVTVRSGAHAGLATGEDFTAATGLALLDLIASTEGA